MSQVTIRRPFGELELGEQLGSWKRRGTMLGLDPRRIQFNSRVTLSLSGLRMNEHPLDRLSYVMTVLIDRRCALMPTPSPFEHTE